MKYFRREDFMKDIYPKIAQRKKFGIVSHKEMFKKAVEIQAKVNILNTRLDILQFIRSFGGEAREIWRQDQRMQELCRVIVKNAIDKNVDPAFAEF